MLLSVAAALRIDAQDLGDALPRPVSTVMYDEELEIDLGTEGYPKKLEVLVEGVEIVGQIDKKLKPLRRLPVDLEVPELGVGH